MSIVINDVAPRVHYVATAGQTVFIIPFEFLAAGDIKIWINGILHYYVTPPVENWQYSLTGIGVSGGGSATFGAPGRYADDKVVIVRDMPIARTADLPTHGVFPVESLNQHLDALTAMVQQTEVNVQQRTLMLVDYDEPVELSTLPVKADRANKLLSFDADGQPITTTTLQSFLDAINAALNVALAAITAAGDAALAAIASAQNAALAAITSAKNAALAAIESARLAAIANMQAFVDAAEAEADRADAAADLAEEWAMAAQLIIIQDTPPMPLPTQRLWWDSSSGNLFVSYSDGTSEQWVQINSTGLPGADGADGPIGPSSPSYLRWACGDETSPVAVGNGKLTDRMPYAFTATGLKASLNIAQASGSTFTVDVKWWNGGAFASILSTLLTFDNTQTTSLSATTQPVLFKTDFVNDDIIRIDVTQVGNGTACGLKVTLLGQKT